MNRKAIYVKLQTEAFIPGGPGALGTVFPSSTKNLQDLDMVSHGTDGVTISFTHKGVKKEMWVPSSNVAFAELAPETSSPTVNPPKVVKVA